MLCDSIYNEKLMKVKEFTLHWGRDCLQVGLFFVGAEAKSSFTTVNFSRK